MATQTTSGSVTTGGKSDCVLKLAENDVASVKALMSSASTSTISSSCSAVSSTQCEGAAIPCIESENDQHVVGEHGAYVPATSGYNYYYSDFGGPFPQLDNNVYSQADGTQAGAQSDSGSMIYYMPGYNGYPSGAVVGLDGHSVAQQSFFPSSGYLQHPVPYGSEAVPCYSWDSTYVGDVSQECAGSGNGRNGYHGSTPFAKSNGFNSMKSNGKIGSVISKSTYAQHAGGQNKASTLGSDFSAGLFQGNQPVGKFSSFTGQKQGAFPHNGAGTFRRNGRVWKWDNRNKSRDAVVRNANFETSTELICGPRASNKNAPLDSTKKEDLGFIVRREQCNLPDFEIEYTNAKFYVIKSYSEDDIHKSIKYDVWSSTPNGNKKLDAAYHKAQERSTDTGKKCPIFLFFSVNGSGQFVGLAEMVGQVDFNKDMDFWQLDKWNGFFPVRWHIIKDIPNNQLRHIVLENNEGNSVTFSRDTQEVGLQQGLEMLKIFKGYSAKSSLLDDFTFYENREKSLQAKKSNKPATLRMEVFENGNGDFTKPTRAGERKFEDDIWTKKSTNTSSLISLTKNLSLSGYNAKHTSVKRAIGNSIPSVPAP